MVPWKKKWPSHRFKKMTIVEVYSLYILTTQSNTISVQSFSIKTRTASTLEAFEQHLMPFRGIHKQCDTCRRILDEVVLYKKYEKPSREIYKRWICLVFNVLDSRRKRTLRGKSKKKESLRLLHLLCSHPLHLCHLLRPKSQTKATEGNQRRSTAEQRKSTKTTLSWSRGEAMWVNFQFVFAIIVSKADREPDQSVQWGHGFDRGWLWGWQAQVGWEEIIVNMQELLQVNCQIVWRGKERDGDVQAGWRWWVHPC